MLRLRWSISRVPRVSRVSQYTPGLNMVLVLLCLFHYWPSCVLLPNWLFFPGTGQLCRFRMGLMVLILFVLFAPFHSKAIRDMCGLYSTRPDCWNCGCVVNCENRVYLRTDLSELMNILLFNFKIIKENCTVFLKYFDKFMERIHFARKSKRSILKMQSESDGQLLTLVYHFDLKIFNLVSEFYVIIKLIVSKYMDSKMLTFIKKYSIY